MTQRAAYADEAFRIGRRRRAARGLGESMIDALLAIGGLVLANAAFGIELGLPEGGVGVSLGAALMCAALAVLTRGRRRVRRPLAPVAPLQARAVLELREAA